MRRYFDRHEKDKAAKNWGIDSKGYQAWLLWGGDAGRRWAKRTLTRENPSTDYKNPPPGFLEGSVIKDTLYHASNYKMGAGDRLDPRVGGEFGIYLSPNRKYARRYGNNLYYVLANIKNPKVVEGKYEISPTDLTEEDARKLKKQGYDGIIVTSAGIGDASEIVAFDAEQVFITQTRQNPSTAYETERTGRGSTSRARHLRPLKTDPRKSRVCCVKPLKRERKAAKLGYLQTAKDLRDEEEQARADTSAELAAIDRDKKAQREKLAKKLAQLAKLRKLNQWAYSNQIRDEEFAAIGNSESDDAAEKNLPEHLIPLWRESRHEYPYHLPSDQRAALFVEDVEQEPEILQAELDELTDQKIQDLVQAYNENQKAEYLQALDQLEDVPF